MRWTGWHELEASNGGNDPADYAMPIYELGAPSNAFNSTSTVNARSRRRQARKFNGVVVDGGVHMDSMLGGNPLIQVAAYLVAGIPQPQNPPAVQWLMAGWVNDMFEGNIDPATGRCRSRTGIRRIYAATRARLSTSTATAGTPPQWSSTPVPSRTNHRGNWVNSSPSRRRSFLRRCCSRLAQRSLGKLTELAMKHMRWAS